MVLPLRPARPSDEEGNQQFHYWSFATIGLYNWHLQNAPFSENPCDLTNLLETVFSTHHLTWDDCQQLLQVLFTIKELGRIVLEAHTLVPGPNGKPTVDPAVIDIGFPTISPNWDHDTMEGKERLKVYLQTLLAGGLPI